MESILKGVGVRLPKYKYVLGMGNPSIREKTKTEQFELSEKLMDKRYELGLSLREMSSITGETPVGYMRLEYGDVDIPIKYYKKALNNLYLYELIANSKKEKTNN